MNTENKCNISYERIESSTNYDSTEGDVSFEYFNENPILKSVAIDTTVITKSMQKCIEFCLKQTQMENLIIYTENTEKFYYMDTQDEPLLKLKFLCIASKLDINSTQDYILPFIKNAPNLERIFYTNGSLTKESNQILCQMAANKLRFLYLDTIHIQNQIFFCETSKKFDKVFWLLRQRYIPNDIRKPNFLISAFRKFFRK